MNIREFMIIISEKGYGDILENDAWSEDYAPDITFTIDELRRLAKRLKVNPWMPLFNCECGMQLIPSKELHFTRLTIKTEGSCDCGKKYEYEIKITEV